MPTGTLQVHEEPTWRRVAGKAGEDTRPPSGGGGACGRMIQKRAVAAPVWPQRPVGHDTRRLTADGGLTPLPALPGGRPSPS